MFPISSISDYEFAATFDALIESPYMALVIVNKEGYITLMNQTFLDSLELTLDDVIGKHVLEILPHSELPQVLETGRVDKADIWPIKDQDTIVTRVPIIKDGEIIGAIGQSLSLDMSGAKIFMKRLEEREKEFTALFAALVESPYMLYVAVDSGGYITAMNQTYLDILNVKKRDVIGKYILDITPNSGLIEVLETGRIDDADIWSIKGHEMIVTRLPIIKNGQIIGAVAKSLFMDMSVAKVLMRKLQETEKDFQAILEGLIESPYMVYVIVDKDGYITTMNQTYLDIIGMQKEDVMGKYILDITPTSELPQILKTGRIDKADIFIIKGRETIVTRLPIIKNGEIVGAIGKSLFLDMSGAKILVKKLHDTEKELNVYKEEFSKLYSAKWQFADLIGKNPVFLAVKSMAEHVAQTNSTLLITGESGTGKELYAQAIHNASPRKSGPFIRINCAALPENLLESELFGYEDGAFTGARRGGKQGKFELARGGTIFLDEIGDMPIPMQTKMLTVLQERTVERIGGNIPITVNVRVIAATNRDLEAMVSSQEFRQDLYYRLNVVRLTIPPLRKRIDDVPLIADALLGRINHDLFTNIKGISERARNLLMDYAWPGNVRELENLLERAVNMANMSHSDYLSIKHFPSLTENSSINPELLEEDNINLPEAMENLEKQIIMKALERTANNKVHAAKMLGIHSSALYRKLSKYGLD
ncbi:MAG: sigma 54-interacting transcriptional regulator [Syntrophomonadaceae bacterium]|nr:sigma 54-interacting transcriptional regulator [Syntrophomonadaceae bacterium]